MLIFFANTNIDLMQIEVRKISHFRTPLGKGPRGPHPKHIKTLLNFDFINNDTNQKAKNNQAQNLKSGKEYESQTVASQTIK